MSTAAPTPSHTLLLLSLPPSLLCGIDLLTFTTPPSATFHGLKHIPPGLHFFFTSETTSLSIRTGFWFQIPHSASTPTLIVRRWSKETNSLVSVEGEEGAGLEKHWAKVSEVWERGLSPYRQSASQDADVVEDQEGGWTGLTEHVTPQLLTHLLQSSTWAIDSASSIPQDRDDIPGLTPQETGLEERELGGLGIDLRRTWREGAVGRERTEGARDRSWKLGDVVEFHGVGEGIWGDVLLGQMEATFVMVLTVANYSCLEEWKRCIGLVLTSKRAVGEREEFFEGVLVLLRRQIETGEDVEGGLFDMSDEGGGLLKGWLRGFKRTLGQVFGEGVGEGEGDGVKRRMEELEAVLRKMYDWELGDEFVRKGMVQLEDGEMVEMEVSDMHGEDEDGDYAPVVVDLEDT